MAAQSSIDQDRVSRLAPQLRTILAEELRLGNAVVETSEGWPGALMVMLRSPFARRYEEEGVSFRPIEDPHYWKEEYRVAPSDHILACRFT
jgi:hypothetical protein